MNDRVVIKIGGSLLAEPSAVDRVGDWLASTSEPGQTRVLIAGGGEAVDALRRIDAVNPVSAEAAHWAAIAIMDAGALLLADWFAGLGFQCCRKFPAAPGDWVLQCGRLLRESKPGAGERLRVGWETTSDAIAARIAVLYDARLVLLKHSLLATYGTLAEAAAAGVIDPETPRIATSLPSVEVWGVMHPGLPHAPR